LRNKNKELEENLNSADQKIIELESDKKSFQKLAFDTAKQGSTVIQID